MTAPQLFAAAGVVKFSRGPERCFYCGGVCGQSHPASQFVKKSFTALDTCCGGDWVCDGCIAAMDEHADITLISGQKRANQRVRCYSWVIDAEHGPRAATKAHRDLLLRTCLDPPPPPYVISLADSGQRHLLYRASVVRDASQAIASLEGQRIDYDPPALAARIELACKIIAATGKPALEFELTPNAAMRVMSHHNDELIIQDWLAMREAPLSRLAAWLAPPKESCYARFPPINA